MAVIAPLAKVVFSCLKRGRGESGGRIGLEIGLSEGFVSLQHCSYSWREFEGCLIMNTETGVMAVSVCDEATPRRSGGDRRESRDRRRGFSGRRGLFEYRADREGEMRDRRQRDRRDEAPRSWWSFWRRDI